LSKQPQRQFDDRPAVRESVPLLVGLVGPSGSGKTFSALRLASGIQEVFGGDVWGIDTEARRMLHYAERFKFRHVEFAAPFGPLDYLAAIEHCRAKGAKTIIIDSGSHEHEGPGGVLEMHAAELERMGGGEKNNFRAWQKPKSDRRRLLNSILQMSVNFIWCFRAKEKIKLQKGKDPINLGWMPIAGEEFIYEFSLNCLLYPNGGGVPQWHPDELGEKAIVKLPQQFGDLFREPKPLSEDIGVKLAEWARGGAPADPLDEGRAAARQGSEALKVWWKGLKPAQQKPLKPALDGELKQLAAAADKAEPGEQFDDAGPIPPTAKGGALWDDDKPGKRSNDPSR
jgi:hypothetical protein